MNAAAPIPFSIASRNLSERRFDVAVLGAGVVGVATAYALARRGLSVALVDKRGAPGGGASFANGAQLSYAYSDALGGPALVKKLPSLLLGSDPLFKLRPSLDPAMIGWGLKFLRRCTAAEQAKGTLETLAMALESQAALHALLQRHLLEFGHATPGKMHLYFDAGALAEACEVVALKRAHGAEQHVLTPGEAMAVEPTLTQARGLVGVVHSPADETGDAHRFCVGLTELLVSHYDVSAEFGFQAEQIRPMADEVCLLGPEGRSVRARMLVVATGIEGRGVLGRIGIRPPLLPMKGYSFNAPPGASAPSVSLTDTRRKLVFCRLNGGLRIAGGAELGGRDTRVDPGRLAALIGEAKASMPDACDYERTSDGWAGLRPMTPSSTPIIARVGARLVLNLGHGMLGWTLAMGSAERAAALVAGERT